MKFEFQLMTLREFLDRCKLTRIPTRNKIYYDFNNIVSKCEDLFESIKTMGIISPVIVDREYYIIDGVKRYIIVKELYNKGHNIPEPIPVLKLCEESFNEKPISILHIAYILNRFRAEPKDEEFSDELITYMQDISYKVREIYNNDHNKAARYLGFSVKTLKRLIEEYLKSLE